MTARQKIEGIEEKLTSILSQQSRIDGQLDQRLTKLETEIKTMQSQLELFSKMLLENPTAWFSKAQFEERQINTLQPQINKTTWLIGENKKELESIPAPTEEDRARLNSYAQKKAVRLQSLREARAFLLSNRHSSNTTMTRDDIERFKKKLPASKNLPEGYQSELANFQKWLDGQANVTWKDAVDKFSTAIAAAEKNLETIGEVSELGENYRRRFKIENELSKLQTSLNEMTARLESLKAERDQSLQIFEKIKDMPVPSNPQ